MDTPDFFVGARLGAARAKAGISLEKAAKDTRIRVQRLREIEADDFSGFVHPTYSRLFLLDYAEYLGVSPDEIRPLLPDRAGSAGGGFQYINALSREPSYHVMPVRPKRPSVIRAFLAAGLVLILAAAGLFAYSTVNKIKRIAGSASLSGKSDDKPFPAVSPSPSAPEEMTPEPSPDPVTVESALPVVLDPSSEPSGGYEVPTPAPAP